MADLDDVVGKISQYKKYLDKYLAKIPEENKVMTTIEMTWCILCAIFTSEFDWYQIYSNVEDTCHRHRNIRIYWVKPKQWFYNLFIICILKISYLVAGHEGIWQEFTFLI